MSNVCLVVEHQGGQLRKNTLNALTFGRQAAAHLGGELHLLVIGRGAADLADQLGAYGAARLWLVEDPALENYTAEPWSLAAAEAARAAGAALVGMASGSTGKDLMPRVAVKLGAGLASDVTGFDGRCFTRPMWAGSVLARVEVLTEIKAVTIQPTAFAAAEPTGGATPVERLSLSLPPARTRFVELQATESQRPDLTEARVVISGGRGLEGRENFRLLEDLADLLGGAVGATRAAVDAGWMPNDLQVGQTGKIVAPELYLAVGLSGSTQHKAGMKNSQVIVAINKDEEAPIFEIADFGLVADLFQALPALTEALRKELASA